MYGDKIAIIGNDISAFMFGISALKEGYDVKMYDYNKGYMDFSSSAFYFPLGEKGSLIRNELDKIMKVEETDVEYFFNYQNTVYMDKDLEVFRKKLLSYSVSDKEKINDFCDAILLSKKTTLYYEKPLQNLSFIGKIMFDRVNKNKNKILKKYNTMSIREYAEAFHSECIKGLICGIMDSRCAMGELFIFLGALYNNTLKYFDVNKYYKALYNEYISLGGKIHYKFDKVSITTSKFKAHDLKYFEDQKEKPAYIVSATDPYFTLEVLLNKYVKDPVLKYGYQSYPVESSLQLFFNCDKQFLPSVFLAEVKNLNVACKPLRDVKFYLNGNVIKCVINQIGTEWDYWSILSTDQAVYKAEIKRIASEINQIIEKYLQVKCRLDTFLTPIDTVGGYKGGVASLMKVPNSVITIKSPIIQGLNNVFLLKWSEGEGLDLLTYLMNTKQILEKMKEGKK